VLKTRSAYTYAADSPLNFRDPSGLWGTGARISGSFEFHVGPVTLAVQASIGLGNFIDLQHGPTSGILYSAGGYAKVGNRELVAFPRDSSEAPEGINNVYGAYGGPVSICSQPMLQLVQIWRAPLDLSPGTLASCPA
jgi:hypothetical protein